MFHIETDVTWRFATVFAHRRQALINLATQALTEYEWLRLDINLAGDRRLILHHQALNRVLLEERDARLVLQHLADLWGYDVLLKEIDPATDSVLKEHAATPRGIAPVKSATSLG